MKPILFVVCSLCFFACARNQNKIRPTIEDISESVYASGVIKSRDQYQVYSTVTGTIEDVLVTEGDIVRRGSPILKISNQTALLNRSNAELAASYAELRANREKLDQLKLTIESTLTKAKNDSLLLIRQRNLWKQNIGSKVELEQMALNYENSSNNYEAAVFNYNELKRQLELAERQSRNNLLISKSIADDYTIKSEIDGKVYSVLKARGELVNSQTPIAIIGNSNTFLLELQIDENDIVQIREHQTVFISMDSYKDQTFEGVITRVEPIMNERSKSFTVEAEFVSPPPLLYPFLTAEANIIIRQQKNAMTIPRAYVVDDQYVLTEKKEKRKISTGLKDYQKVQVVGGLQPDDIIIMPEN